MPLLSTRSTKDRHRSVGAFLADLLRAYSDGEPTPNPWVYRSMHKQSFSGTVSYRMFKGLVDGLKQLGFIQHIDGHRVDSEDRGKRSLPCHTGSLSVLS
jgi:hypothetical protein